MNDLKFSIYFVWLPKEIGGHSAAPFEGMRTVVSWQRNFADQIDVLVDVSWSNVKFQAVPDMGECAGKGEADCSIREIGERSKLPLQSGELLEFRSSYKIIAIGRVI
jgi:hypothetical protein